MKGVILAGGKGLRLYPLTKATNKHLLPVGREPMIYHCIRQLCSAGISEILVVTSTDHMGDVVRCLGSGTEFGCTLSYKVQETAGGIIPGAQLIPIEELEERAREVRRSEKPLLIYCAGGGRSAAACEFLSGQGQLGLQNLSGGIGSWGGAVTRPPLRPSPLLILRWRQWWAPS